MIFTVNLCGKEFLEIRFNERTDDEGTSPIVFTTQLQHNDGD